MDAINREMTVGKTDPPSVLVMSMSFTTLNELFHLCRLSPKEGLARPNSLAWKHSSDLRRIEMRY